MFVTRVDTIELVEDFLDILLLDALPCVTNGETEMLMLVVIAESVGNLSPQLLQTGSLSGDGCFVDGLIAAGGLAEAWD